MAPLFELRWGNEEEECGVMAIIFELAINFGDKVDAAGAAARTAREIMPTTLQAGRHSITLQPPVVIELGPYTGLSIMPIGVGYGAVGDHGIPRIKLTAAELTELAHQMYRLLANLDGYITAKVGWEPEMLLDPTELKSDWSDELHQGTVDGLVIADALYDELGLNDKYSVFRPGYRWIPYSGESPSALTAD
ncbi:hypothetical protein AB0L82_35805 [Nocardia sp. NPDC052001]|uniref:hypothetical protein n=1 Tax=Nocardia sp. NPDC052001 TaxID=3154853 RepID=UPI00342E67A5